MLSPLELTDIEAAVRVLEALGVILAAIYGYRAKLHSEQSARDAGATRAQVENSHGTNLRDDIDVIRAGIRSLGHQLGEIRRDMDADQRDVTARLRNLEDRL